MRKAVLGNKILKITMIVYTIAMAATAVFGLKWVTMIPIMLTPISFCFCGYLIARGR